jgi:large subunit ribosomal protein L25
MGGHTIDLEHKTVKLAVDATAIPEFVEVHFNKEGAGFHVLAGDIKIPAGAVLELSPDVLIASVIVNAAEHSAELAAAAEAPKA